MIDFIDAMVDSAIHRGWTNQSLRDALTAFVDARIEAANPAADEADLADLSGSVNLGAPRRWHGHSSDCAVHNGPALPVGPCDCGYAQPPTVTDAEVDAVLKALWQVGSEKSIGFYRVTTQTVRAALEAAAKARG